MGGRGRNEALLFNGYRVSIWGDKKKFGNSGDGHTILQMPSMLANCTVTNDKNGKYYHMHAATIKNILNHHVAYQLNTQLSANVLTYPFVLLPETGLAVIQADVFTHAVFPLRNFPVSGNLRHENLKDLSCEAVLRHLLFVRQEYLLNISMVPTMCLAPFSGQRRRQWTKDRYACPPSHSGLCSNVFWKRLIGLWEPAL